MKQSLFEIKVDSQHDLKLFSVKILENLNCKNRLHESSIVKNNFDLIFKNQILDDFDRK